MLQTKSTPAELGRNWAGKVVDDKFPLRQWLGGSDHSAVFLTERATGGGARKAAIKLIPAQNLDGDAQLSLWKSIARLSHPHLIQLFECGRCQIEGTRLLYVVMESAEENLEDLAGCSDFIRPAVYNNVAGGRFVSYVKGARGSVYGDLPPEATLEMLYKQLNYDEAPHDKLAATGFSADYVERETRRSVEAVAGHPVQIWPGVDIDVPVSAKESHCTPESVAQAVKAAFKGGAEGIILSRNYIEMKPENLSGAGKALRELGAI